MIDLPRHAELMQTKSRRVCLLLAVTCMTVLMAFFVVQGERRRHAVLVLRSKGGRLQGSPAGVSVGFRGMWLPWVGRRITAVDFSDAAVGDSDVPEIVSAIREIPSIASVYWDNTDLTDAGAVKMAALDQLIELRFVNCHVGDATARAAAQMPALESLVLAGTEVTDAGVAALKFAPRLQRLFVDSTAVTDRGIIELAELPQLVELSVSNTEVTEAGVQRLLQVHPNLDISDD